MTEILNQNNVIDDSDKWIIHAENLCKHVETSEGRLDILTSVSLTIKSGESVAIVGASGSGKSTLLCLLAGLDLPSNGRVELAGICLTAQDEDGRARIRGENVGFVFQSFQLLPSLTALDNVMLPLELAANERPKEIALSLMARVGLERRINHYPMQLSGGEQQRVAIARAFVTHPKILFADEPTGNLDSKTGEQIINLLFDLNREKNTTLVLVSHDEALAVRCTRRIHLEAGRIIASSSDQIL